MSDIEKRIQKTVKKLHKLQQEKERIEAKKLAKGFKAEQIGDSRKKILVGTVILDKVSRGEISTAEFDTWLDSGLFLLEDRALFSLGEKRHQDTQ